MIKLAAAFSGGLGGAGLYILVPPPVMTFLAGRALLIIALALGAVALAMAARLLIDWIADAAGYPFPRKERHDR